MSEAERQLERYAKLVEAFTWVLELTEGDPWATWTRSQQACRQHLDRAKVLLQEAERRVQEEDRDSEKVPRR